MDRLAINAVWLGNINYPIAILIGFHNTILYTLQTFETTFLFLYKEEQTNAE